MKIPRMLLLIIVIAAFSVTNVLAVRMIDDPTTSRPTQKQLTTPEAPKIQPQPEEIKKVQAAQPENAVEEEQYVTMDFDGVDIKVFIKFIADVTGKNFIVDDKVTGKITVISPTKISLEEAYVVFLSVLEVNGFSTVPSNGIIKIVRSADAITKSIETKMAGKLQREDRMITQIIPLKYADANDMKTLLTPLISKGTSQLLVYPQSNILIITDNMSNISKIQDILKVVDVTGFAQEVRIFPLTYASAGDLSAKLTQILSEEETPARRTVRRTTATVSAKAETKIIPDERINALIVLASAIDMQEIEVLIKKLDIPTPTGKEDIHVYYLQYANAEDLASVLSEVPAPESPEAAKAVAAKATTKTTKESFKISADKETNSLIIYADPYTYKSILDTIKFLDIPRKQVYVKAVIMEVNTTRDFKVGVEWT
ncbi:MAG: type II secretion system protein GspD, partial [Deltaproteobacteria bacterium]|nr:type II secretion system protein GspD [Deltaproteobacteria bacterium]